ncbi:MAG: putative Copper resistance protein CopC, partial [Ilumatobacteraceae bacterium]|nr:putative Copper resistance protein CopC [Ilumatobacteraceae bacterium]
VTTGVVSAYGGHGATGRWIAVGVLATTVHVSAMALWLGGLVALVLGFSTVTLAGARRFSALALGAIAAVIASGVVQSIRQLGSIDALRSTHYGTVLIWKVVFVAVLLFVANVSRRVVRRRRGLEPTVGAEEIVDRPRLRRAVTIEGILAIAIVVSTSMLMAANPSEVAASRPFSIQLLDGTYLAAVTIEPGHIGANELHIYLSSAESSLIEPDEVHVEISDPSRAVAAIDIPVTRSGASHYTTPTATFPYAATWTLLITARYNTFDEVQFTAKVPIR